MVWLETMDVGDRFKKGPMSRSDWTRLECWLQEKAGPRKEPELMPTVPTRFNKGKMSKADWENHKEWLKINTVPRKEFKIKEAKRSKVPINALMPRVEILCCPKYITEKTISKPYKFESNVKPSTLKYNASERVKLLSVPRTITEKASVRKSLPLMHAVASAALHYQFTQRIADLARPRSVPVAENEKQEEIPRDMDYENFFMQNRTKPKPDMSIGSKPKRKYKSLSALAPTMDKLSKPRLVSKKFQSGELFSDPITKVTKSALNAKPSANIDTLSKPRHPSKKGPQNDDLPSVSKPALHAVASQRVRVLAIPKQDFSIVITRRKSSRNKRKSNNKTY